MKRNALLFATAVTFYPLVSIAAPPVQSGLPPPEMHAKGVDATSAPVADSESLTPAMPDTRLVRDKASRTQNIEKIIASSDSVTERKEGHDTVREYRKNGHLRMVQVIPESGPEHDYLDQNGDGRLDRDITDGPVSPVYFTLYQWD